MYEGALTTPSIKNGRISMLKSFIAAASLLLISEVAYAQDVKCDDATTMMVEKQVNEMPANMMMQKDEAMKHLDMARDAMKANNTTDCVMHLQEAEKASMKKM